MNNSRLLFISGSLFFALFFSLQASASRCETAHKEAVSKCSVYEHGFTPEQLSIVGKSSRKRAAQKHSEQYFSWGTACARAQAQCIQSCEKALTGTGQKDVSEVVELSQNCGQGEVAKHRSQLAKRYTEFKRISDDVRDPAALK